MPTVDLNPPAKLLIGGPNAAAVGDLVATLRDQPGWHTTSLITDAPHALLNALASAADGASRIAAVRDSVSRQFDAVFAESAADDSPFDGVWQDDQQGIVQVLAEHGYGDPPATAARPTTPQRGDDQASRVSAAPPRTIAPTATATRGPIGSR